MHVLSEGNFTEKEGPSRHHFFGLLFLDTLPHPTDGGEKKNSQQKFTYYTLYIKSFILY